MRRLIIGVPQEGGVSGIGESRRTFGGLEPFANASQMVVGAAGSVGSGEKVIGEWWFVSNGIGDVCLRRSRTWNLRFEWVEKVHEPVDEPPHQIRSYTLLFSLFLHFPYITDPPLRTSAPTRPCSRSHVIALAPSDRSRLFDGHMTYDSHVFTSILSISNVPPPAVRPITRSRTARSGTFYSFAICSHSCLPFVFNLAVFTFHKGTSSPKP